MIKQCVRIKIQLISLFDINFPELQYIFKSGIHSKTLYTLFKKYSSTEEIAALRDKILISILSKVSKSHYKEDNALKLKSRANFYGHFYLHAYTSINRIN